MVTFRLSSREKGSGTPAAHSQATRNAQSTIQVKFTLDVRPRNAITLALPGANSITMVVSVVRPGSGVPVPTLVVSSLSAPIALPCLEIGATGPGPHFDI